MDARRSGMISCQTRCWRKQARPIWQRIEPDRPSSFVFITKDHTDINTQHTCHTPSVEMVRIRFLCTSSVLLLLTETSSLSSPGTANVSFRKSSLLPWNPVVDDDGKSVLGHCVEERDESTNVLTVRIRTSIEDEDDDMVGGC